MVVQGYSGYRNRYQSKAHKRLPCLLSFPVGQKLVENLRFSQFGFKLSSDFKLSQGGGGVPLHLEHDIWSQSENTGAKGSRIVPSPNVTSASSDLDL